MSKTKLKMEHIPLDEKETFIHIDEFNSTITITTNCLRVFNALSKEYGGPHKAFSPIYAKQEGFISGAVWAFNYKKEREQIKPILSMVNLLPHS